MSDLLAALCCAALLSALTAGAAAPANPAARLEETHELESAPTPVCAPPPDRDMGLVQAMLFAVEPAPIEIRVRAVEDLGLLGDPRALNLLSQLVLDPNRGLQAAAVRAVASIQHPRAEEILGNVVRHPTLGEPLKLQALRSVIFQNSRTALRLVAQVARSGTFTAALQTNAAALLADVPPARLTEVGP